MSNSTKKPTIEEILKPLLTLIVIVTLLIYAVKSIAFDDEKEVTTTEKSPHSFTSYDAIQQSRSELIRYLGYKVDFPFSSNKTEALSDTSWMIGGKFEYPDNYGSTIEQEYFCIITYRPSNKQVSCENMMVGEKIFKCVSSKLCVWDNYQVNATII